MTAVLPSPEVQAAGCERLLRDVCDDYYAGCKRHAAAYDRHQPDSPLRVFWRIRLAVLQEVGDRLAAALGVAEPDWEAMRELVEGADR